jgi:hypothetical protein
MPPETLEVLGRLLRCAMILGGLVLFIVINLKRRD